MFEVFFSRICLFNLKPSISSHSKTCSKLHSRLYPRHLKCFVLNTLGSKTKLLRRLVKQKLLRNILVISLLGHEELEVSSWSRDSGLELGAGTRVRGLGLGFSMRDIEWLDLRKSSTEVLYFQINQKISSSHKRSYQISLYARKSFFKTIDFSSNPCQAWSQPTRVAW